MKTWFNNLSFRTKLLIPILFVSAGLAVMAGVGISGVSRIDGVLRTVTAVHMPGVTYLLQADRDLYQARMAERSMIFVSVESNDFKELRDLHEKSIDNASSLLRQFQSIQINDNHALQTDELMEKLELWKLSSMEVIKQRQRDTRIGRRLAIDFSFGKAAEKFRDMSTVINTMMEQAISQSTADARQSTEYTNSVSVLLSSFGAVGLGFCLLIAFVFPQLIVSRLSRAVEIANNIARGRLTNDIASSSRDEIGQLLDSLRVMNDSLNNIVHRVRQSSDQILTGSVQIAEGSTDLSQRTEEQAGSLEETAASMEEMTGTVKQNADSAKTANELANHASKKAVEGGEVVNRAVMAMSDIKDSSNRISDIISTIDSIAFQTNLLALNAAVEAARAGDQGRGFAVVASEVRVLAQRSAESAKEIKSLIDDSVDKVSIGTGLVNESGTTLTEIVNGINGVAEIVAMINDSSQEQSVGIDQVNNAVSQMDDMTQQNAALVEQSAAASRSMQGQARELMSLIKFFDLGDRVGSPSVIKDQRNEQQAAGKLEGVKMDVYHEHEDELKTKKHEVYYHAALDKIHSAANWVKFR